MLYSSVTNENGASITELLNKYGNVTIFFYCVLICRICDIYLLENSYYYNYA